MLRKSVGLTFLTAHAEVLLCVAEDPTVRLRDLATRAGVTERSVQRIVRVLADSGYITLQRQGRRTMYRVHVERSLLCSFSQHLRVEELLGLVRDARRRPSTTARRGASR